jgi:hypothetical protein
MGGTVVVCPRIIAKKLAAARNFLLRLSPHLSRTPHPDPFALRACRKLTRQVYSVINQRVDVNIRRPRVLQQDGQWRLAHIIRPLAKVGVVENIVR